MGCGRVAFFRERFAAAGVGSSSAGKPSLSLSSSRGCGVCWRPFLAFFIGAEDEEEEEQVERLVGRDMKMVKLKEMESIRRH